MTRRRRRSDPYYPPRRRRRTPRKRSLLYTRAPRKGTLLIATTFYIIGIFGVLDFLPISQSHIIFLLAIAGGLLILGALLRDL
jgi:hypothetical protein